VSLLAEFSIGRRLIGWYALCPNCGVPMAHMTVDDGSFRCGPNGCGTTWTQLWERWPRVLPGSPYTYRDDVWA
jgi:hypothetical protein